MAGGTTNGSLAAGLGAALMIAEFPAGGATGTLIGGNRAAIGPVLKARRLLTTGGPGSGTLASGLITPVISILSIGPL